MFKLIATDVVVSKGFDNNPALRFRDGENGPSVRFRVGKQVFDTRCEDNHRWVNLGVKAFGDVCERIKKMKLKEGSFVNIIGRYDEETWTDKNTQEKKSAPVVIIEEIEYCYRGDGQKNSQNGAAQSVPNQEQPAMPPQGQYGTPPQQYGVPPQQYGTPPQGQPQPNTPPAPMPGNFTGFEGFYGGGDSIF